MQGDGDRTIVWYSTDSILPGRSRAPYGDQETVNQAGTFLTRSISEPSSGLTQMYMIPEN